jgi:hypothetical protein
MSRTISHILLGDRGDDVVNMSGETDLGPREMAAVAQAGQRRRQDAVPRFAEERNDLVPEPGAMPGGVHQDEDRRLHGAAPGSSSSERRAVDVHHNAVRGWYRPNQPDDLTG